MNHPTKANPDTVDEPDNAADDAAPETTKAPVAGRYAVVPMVVGLICLALVAITAWQVLRIRDDRVADERDDSAVRIASAQALTLLGISEGNVDDRIDELLKNSTGDFQSQLSGIRDTFGKLVTEGEVTSDGNVASAALVSVTDDDARVLLALTSQVTNNETKEPESRSYRITVDLARKEDKWLVSGMQFAP